MRLKPFAKAACGAAKTCPARSTQAARHSLQNWVEGKGEHSGWCRPATESDQISDCSLPEGAESREGKKGRRSRVRFLPPPTPSLARMSGHREAQRCPQQKRMCFLGTPPKKKELWNESPIHQSSRGRGRNRYSRVLFIDSVGLKQTLHLKKGWGAGKEGLKGKNERGSR